MSETRQEAYLTYLAGDTDVTLPEPVTQLEKYWHDIAARVSGAVDAPTGTIELVENGEYSVAKYATAKVNVPEGNYERLTQIDSSGKIAYVDFSGSSSLSSFFVVTGESSKQGVVEVGDVLQIGLNKELFGDAADEQVVSGVTYTSKNGLKRTGSHVCSGGTLVGGELLLDETVTTASDPYSGYKYDLATTALSSLREGDLISVKHNNTTYVTKCGTNAKIAPDKIYAGNPSVYGVPAINYYAGAHGMTVEEFLTAYPDYNAAMVDTGESFLLMFNSEEVTFHTKTEGIHHFVVSLLAISAGSGGVSGGLFSTSKATLQLG